MAVRLRRISESDKELLFRWTNDPETRKQSFSTQPVPWENHVSWFQRKMEDPGCYHYLMLDGDEPVGVVRLDRLSETGEDRGRDSHGRYAYLISVNIAPQMRGRGYGKSMYRLIEKQALAEIPDSSYIRAEVKIGNLPSRKSLEATGYETIEITETEPVEVIYKRRLKHETVIYFRADANAQIGYGHLMRCLTIADACEKLGMQPVFLLADHEAEQLVLDRGYPVCVLETQYRRMEEELIVLREKIRDDALIVLDSYFLTQHYVRTLKEEGHALVWMDDLGEADYPVDCLINYNMYADTLGYESKKAAGKYLLGTHFAPVRPGFCGETYQAAPELLNILITTGASDPCGAGLLFAEGLLKKGIRGRIQVVCGRYYPDAEKLRELEKEQEGQTSITLLQNLTDLSQVMKASDLAIAAAGSTLYELCAVGVPTLVYYFADNQKRGAQAFAEKTGSVNLGDLRLEKQESFNRAYQAVCRLQDQKERRAVSERMQSLVDAKGAQRIARELRDILKNRNRLGDRNETGTGISDNKTETGSVL